MFILKNNISRYIYSLHHFKDLSHLSLGAIYIYMISGRSWVRLADVPSNVQ